MRIVALRALGLGDLLTAVPALRALRRAYPDAHLSLAAPAWLAPMVTLLDCINELVDTAPLSPLAPRLHGADLAVNLHGQGPQSTELLRASSPERLLSYGVGPVWRNGEREAARWCRLLQESGIPADPDDLRVVPPTGLPVEAGVVLVHVGSAAASRRWPLDRWAQVVRALPGRVRLTAGPGEEQVAREVARQAGLTDQQVLQELSLPALTRLVAASRLLVAPDTGVAHLATAVGTPSVVLFGPVPPQVWGAPPSWRQHRALWAGVESDNHGAGTAPGMLLLTPAQVLEACVQVLEISATGPG